jgi:predicted DNA-binding protein with PD1-like motif
LQNIICRSLFWLGLLGPLTMTFGESVPRAMAPKMWHKISDGEPVVTSTITEGSYIVLKDDQKGTASFQIALVQQEDVLKQLTRFQEITGITAGKGTAVFNVRESELDQWIKPADSSSPNHVPNEVKKGREGLAVCLFSGRDRESPTQQTPAPHCHGMLAGFDDPNAESLGGGFPAVGGHLGKSTVNVIFEMIVDAYPETLEKASGGPLGGRILSVSEEQRETARLFLQQNPHPR